jgi:hypothetical protein
MLTRIAEAKAISGAAKGEQMAFWLYGADEALKELANILFDSELLHRGEKLDDKLEKTLGEVSNEAKPGRAGLGRVWVGMWDMAGGCLGGVLRCNSHVSVAEGWD